jgi:hypothetical protein
MEIGNDIISAILISVIMISVLVPLIELWIKSNKETKELEKKSVAASKKKHLAKAS